MGARTGSDPRTIHLPGLNALRFYAAMSVVIVHTDHNFAELRSQPADIALFNLLAMDAQSAVSLFFVLSGFLITFLLLRENVEHGSISVRRFYLRRILRIWPLYYLTVAIGFLGIPLLIGTASPFTSFPASKIVIVLILFPNFVTGLGPLEHLWSIGLEEQFYLTWPWVLKQKEKLIPIIAGIILVKLLVLPAVLLMNTDSITNLFYSLRFECMAIGGLGAYLYHTQNKHLALLYSKPAQVLSLGCIILLAVTDIPLSEPMILITAFLFMVLILNLTTFSIWGPRLETPALNVLGRVSYGIYMFHYPLLYVVLYLLHQSGLSEGAGYNAILFGAVVSGTLILSFLSYRLLESPFLYIKKRFAFVQTRT